MFTFKTLFSSKYIQTEKEKNFKHNVKTLIFGYLCVLCSSYTAISLHFLHESFNTMKGKFDRYSLFLIGIFQMISQYSFFPTLIQILDISSLSTRDESIIKFCLKAFPPYLKFSCVPLLLVFFFTKIDIYTATSLIAATFFPPLCGLFYMFYILTQRVIDRLKILVDQEKAHGESIKYNTLLKKVKFFRKTNVGFVIVGFLINTIVVSRRLLMIPQIFILADFYEINICNVSIPIVVIFSKYILPDKATKALNFSRPFQKRSSTSKQSKNSQEPKPNFVSIGPSAAVYPS
eukprot:snap_masked-scaffold_33-processed-gene-1.15-mRNA-1 protein AED:1.00 eAED:1.00 QI:0/-1/0/0/-1/1/1/0/289